MALREVNEETLKLLHGFEKLRLYTYDDGYGYPTIGWGHRLLPGESYPNGITEEFADILLQRDLAHARASVSRLIPVYLTDNQYGAVVSFTYNAGNMALKRSTLRQKLLAHNYDAAPHEFMKYNKAGRPLRVSKGLIRRRAAEVALFQAA